LEGLDKNIPTPLYYQLLQILRAKIEEGIWKPGDTIPTENDIISEYKISRSTVRQAILALVNDGYLRRAKSKGTIVTNPTGRLRFVGSLMSFSEEMERKGIKHSSKILDQKIIPADEAISKKLNLSTGDEVYYLKRIRYLDDKPYLVDEHFIPHHLCPGIETTYRENTSLYHLLQTEYLFNLHHGEIEFEPIIPPSKEVIELLNIYSTTNLIYVERIVRSEEEVPLDFFKAILHGKFSIDVVSSAELT
jgi:GntR family transcriptional regulator